MLPSPRVLPCTRSHADGRGQSPTGRRRGARNARAGAALLIGLTFGVVLPSARAQEPAAQALSVSAAPDAPAWVRANDVVRFTLSRPAAPDEGRIAILVGDTDWSSLAETSGTTVTLRPSGVGFTRGEHSVVVYLVSEATGWREIGRSTLRVLTEGGFEQAVTTPSVEVGLTGQAAISRTPEVPPADRDTYQDLTVRLGVASTHVRNGWTTTTDARVVGVNYRNQALRFGSLADEAPLLDLGSYQLGLRNHVVALSAGHGTFGTHRLLLNGLQSRGLSGRLRLGSAVDLSLSAANGTSIVGFGNLFGVGEADHRIVSATIGVELVPSRRGAFRVATSVMDGSVRPQTNVNQGAVRDPEESRGIGVQVSATDAKARFVLDAGVARSRFVNPVDPSLPAGIAVVPVRETTRDARYLDVSYALVQGARLGESALASLTAGFRHNRVDPLYRSVSLQVRPDLEQNAVDVTTALGAFTSRATWEQTRDNLAEIGSILTTRSRQLLWSSALPLHAFGGPGASAAAWPTITYELTRLHQFGDGLPDGGLFDSLSHVPDQVSLNQTLGVAWQGAAWRGGYGWNRSFQDNRQPGRERADLRNVVHTFSLGAAASTVLDAGVEFAFEDADVQELARTDSTRRVSVNVLWRPASKTSLGAVVTRNRLEDNPRTSERRTTDLNLTFTQGVSLLPRQGERLQGQFFVRYVRQTIYGLLLGLPRADDTRFWTFNTGLTFRVF